ncbi:MAG: hypothetical protein JW889_00970 [Verrucomicrobia bacterium]|nr:hypothetical protein [Verrucomicrobiota bacterium]
MLKRFICIGLVVVVGASVVLAPAPTQAQQAEDLEKLQLMLLGLIAVHSSAVMTMEAFRAGLLTKEEAQAEVERNEKFMAVLTKSGTDMKQRLAIDERADTSFIQDYLQVCSYVKLALESLATYIDGEKDLEKRLFDRYVAKCEEAMTRLLKQESRQE